ncbi:gamma-glutamyltransferase family protein, partial [Terracidiphilus sp.]|uniref:gamma-glutamyltransferase family protein n=1 Tax=Terracidiphilus sp. TaxID=1964191 RepID=UPI003C221839
MNNRAVLAFLAAIAVTSATAQQPLDYKGEQPTRAQHGMVVSVHHLASDAGVQILQDGGNAVDAAVATGFALAVTHPAAGNLGGGGFLLLRRRNGKATFIDYREKAPLAATETMYQDAQGNIIPGASVTGYKAIATPGSVAGLVYAEKKYGKLGLKKVMAPAIKLASEGFLLTSEEAHELATPGLADFADSKRIFQRDGNLYKDGDVFQQPDLARTLQRIADNPKDFYHGKIAHQLVDEVKKGGGLLTLQDLAQYKVAERKPIVGKFHNYTVISSPPPSSGGIVLVTTLNILSGYDLAKLGDRSPASIHLITEAYRRAFMDRTEPSAKLVRPAEFLPPAPTNAGSRHESNNTTHYSVVDKDGNAVSVTTTLNNGFGSDVTAGSLGFLLNDEMDDFASKRNTPNMFGLIQGPANAIAPGKRPLSAMTPTIVLEDNKLRYVLGSPGGPRIITTVANILLSATEGGLNIQEAVDAPRFHHQYLPDKLYMEPGFAPETVDALKAMGYDVSVS